jgi:uncharacterized C2H2 Zn-finger protein
LDIARDWELSTDDKMHERMEAERKKNEKMSVTCPQCGLVHSLAKCPRCSAAPKEAMDKDYIKSMLEQLTVFEWEAKKIATKKEGSSAAEKQVWFSELLGLAKERKKDRGWAAHRFFLKFGYWPKGLIDIPREPSKKVRGFDTNVRIKYLKGKAKGTTVAQATSGRSANASPSLP